MLISAAFAVEEKTIKKRGLVGLGWGGWGGLDGGLSGGLSGLSLGGLEGHGKSVAIAIQEKPVPVAVPHPVAVPVDRPYPVKVRISYFSRR